jgi:1-acylglycerone phosphate reductase
MRTELEPLGFRVVTMMTGSTDTPMFNKPGGQMKLVETSYYYHVQEAAYKEPMDHRSKASKVEVLVEKLVKDIIGVTSGIVWHWAFSSIVRFVTWGLPTWVVDNMVNTERGVGLVKPP